MKYLSGVIAVLIFIAYINSDLRNLLGTFVSSDLFWLIVLILFVFSIVYSLKQIKIDVDEKGIFNSRLKYILLKNEILAIKAEEVIGSKSATFILSFILVNGKCMRFSRTTPIITDKFVAFFEKLNELGYPRVIGLNMNELKAELNDILRFDSVQLSNKFYARTIIIGIAIVSIVMVASVYIGKYEYARYLERSTDVK